MSTDKVLKAIRDVVEAFDELPSHHPARYAHLNINGLRAVLATPPAQAQGVATLKRLSPERVTQLLQSHFGQTGTSARDVELLRAIEDALAAHNGMGVE